MSVIHMSENVFNPREGSIDSHVDVLAQINSIMGQPEGMSDLLGMEISTDLVQGDLYKRYLLDESYMWAIRTFLVNAHFNGEISEDRYKQILSLIGTPKGRENVAASLMLIPVLNANKIELVSEVCS